MSREEIHSYLKQIDTNINTIKQKIDEEKSTMITLQIMILGDDFNTKQKRIFEIVKRWHGTRILVLSKQLETLYCSRDWICNDFKPSTL